MVPVPHITFRSFDNDCCPYECYINGKKGLRGGGGNIRGGHRTIFVDEDHTVIVKMGRTRRLHGDDDIENILYNEAIPSDILHHFARFLCGGHLTHEGNRWTWVAMEFVDSHLGTTHISDERKAVFEKVCARLNTYSLCDISPYNNNMRGSVIVDYGHSQDILTAYQEGTFKHDPAPESIPEADSGHPAQAPEPNADPAPQDERPEEKEPSFTDKGVK